MFVSKKEAGPLAGLALSVAFGLLLTAVTTADLLFGGELSTEAPLSVTVRLPAVGIVHDTMEGGATYVRVRTVFPRGSTLAPDELRLLRAYEHLRRPPGASLLAGLGLVFTLLLLVFSAHLRTHAPRQQTLRTQLTLLGSLLLFAVGAKVYLLATAASALWLPLSLLVIPVAVHLGQRTAAATTLAGALLLSLLTPIDVSLLLVLLAQGLAAGFIASRPLRFRVALAGVAGAVGGGLCFVATSLLLRDSLHFTTGNSGFWASDIVASLGGGLLGGILALVFLPAMGMLLGFVTRSKLIALSNLEAPLLKQLATQASGTWGHTMAMANMAEMAASAIGANPLLARVGALYHDVGKSVEPEYFIENQEGTNPHNTLDPDVSADAIIAHVGEGVRLAHKHKLPEQVIEFIHTHHGDGLLEFFWHKNLEGGNPKDLAEREFHYPGCPPSSRETAIVSLCDAVEAASRTLENYDEEKIRRLVRQITLTKLEQGMFSASGLKIQDLHTAMASIVETLRGSRHGRIRYPWQEGEKPSESDKEEVAEEAQAPAQPKAAPGPAPSRPRVVVKRSEFKVSPPGSDPAWVEEVDDQERSRVATKPFGVRTVDDPDTSS
jgi:putative nucleotidyltransferase with HDIG domain